MIIRQYKTDDFEQIADIYNAAHPEEFYREKGQFSLVPWAEDKHILSILDSSDVYVYEEAAILGFCGFLDNKLNWMFVEPTARGKGVAAKLLEHVLPKLPDHSFLFVLKTNVRAIALYEKFGFVVQQEFIVNFQGSNIVLTKMIIKKRIP
ncbi:GNAT family N-acetyltransferase [Colwellia sp. 20A7]|uniref:GNAT family N-acetyltransferase n=1 Tax=Colwellia sp. 20A7 TaxID=2689569 RepID=UPI001357150B|nr:GNAT family N-acetyltransferase [Colwellia sp. 20A7]